jgi:hypothetical protein
MHALVLAGVIAYGSAADSYFLPVPVIGAIAGLVFLAGGLAARYRRVFIQWLDGRRGQNWGLVPALIDVISVVVQTEQGRGGEYVVGYLATLTYFYRNPDLQAESTTGCLTMRPRPKLGQRRIKDAP